MKNVLYVVLALMAVAFLVFYVLPTALYPLFWAALVIGAACAVYAALRGSWRKKKVGLLLGASPPSERRVSRPAQKSLREMERDLPPTAASETKPRP